MAELEKMVITGYEKSDYKGNSKEFIVQINPATLSCTKKIGYERNSNLGSGSEEMRYIGHKEYDFSFKIVLDATGILPDSKKSIGNMVNQLEEVLYTINSESHEPRYVVIIWGTLLFEGRVTSLNYDYSLFSPDGIPLRVTISLSFSSHTNKDISNKKEGKRSPDLTRIVTLKDGETIAGWCDKIYNDPSFCFDIAKCNGLSSFRNVKPGTALLFPPLDRNGRITN